MENIYERTRSAIALEAIPEERAEFIRKVYSHLAGAVLGFVLIEYALFQTALAGAMLNFISSFRFGWIALLGGFMLAGWLARGLASGGASKSTQYVGLAIYVFAEAVIFLPLLYIAAYYTSKDVIPSAALITALLFSGLTMVVFTTRKDFSFLSSALTVGGFVALGLIISSVIFGFNLGVIFSAFMVLFAGGAILYDTSRIMKTYNTDQYVGASLELFASVALLFWYILRLVMSFSRD